MLYVLLLFFQYTR